MAEKLDKQQVGVLLAVAVAVIILIVYCYSVFGSSDTKKEEKKKESKSAMSFDEGPKEARIKDEKEKYVSTMEQYEKEGEKKPLEFFESSQ